MKENWKYKRLFYLMLLVVVFCLGLTAIIFTGLIEDADSDEETYWFFAEAKQTGRPVELENSYVYTNDKGELEFIYNYTTYVIPAHLEQDFQGVADIVVEGDKITKIQMKTEDKSGILQSYNDGTITVKCAKEDINTGADGTDGTNNSDGTNNEVTEQNELVELSKAMSLPIYEYEDEKTVQSDWNKLIIGTSKIKCVMDGDMVCALVIEESLPSDIRVVIKNGSSIYHSNLYVLQKGQNTFVNVANIMSEKNLTEMTLSDDAGLVLCKSDKTALGAAYEGTFRIIKTEEGYVLVNELPIETYVKYVLPSEMPKNFHPEALKAQAVCARTFAFAQMSNQSYAIFGANLDDSTDFQVYHKSGRYEETDAAVDATKGEIITCGGKLITCYYFSTSAGMTNDMSVWASTTPNYIGMMQSEDTNSPFYKWNAYLDITQVQESGRGQLKKIEVIKKNDAGYVTELKLTYAKETVTLTKENDIRKALGKYQQEVVLSNGKIRTDLTMIPSANFNIISIENGKVQLSGGGFGHGIGMSQYGANRMAESGIGYKAIIEHYYKDVVVKYV